MFATSIDQQLATGQMVPPQPAELRVKLFSSPSALNTFQVDGDAEEVLEVGNWDTNLEPGKRLSAWSDLISQQRD